MSKYVRNNKKSWTFEDVHTLSKLARENTPLRVIGFKLGRTEKSIQNKASTINLSLRKTNQQSYGRR